MTTGAQQLFDAAEDRIAQVVDTAIADRGNNAMSGAASEYMMRFRDLCGPQFEGVINDAMADANAKILAAARELWLRKVRKATLDKLITGAV